VEALVGEAFNRLDTNAQKVMQALAVYNRPVTPAAVDYLLAPHIPAMDSAPILQRLANMHFARKESGRFYLHPVDREFAFGLIGNGESGVGKSDSSRSPIPNVPIPDSRYTQHDLTSRAADYFAQARKPRAEWKKLDDLSAQLAEFDLRCAAGDYDTAASVLNEIHGGYLFLWGHYRLMIQMHEKIAKKINTLVMQMWNLNGLGIAHYNLGNIHKSIEYFEKGILIAQEAKNKYRESAFLGNLGNAYAYLGNQSKSIEYMEKALEIMREIGNRGEEGKALGNLGPSYASLGKTYKAIEFYEQALLIAREIRSKTDEARWLGGLSGIYSHLVDVGKTIELSEQAFLIATETGDKKSESAILNILGWAYDVLGNAKKAIKFYEKSLSIARELGNRHGEGTSLSNLGGTFADLGDAHKAIELYEQALIIDRETDNRNGESIRLKNIGHAWLSLGKYKNAKENYRQAIQIADEISYPSIQLNSRNGLANVYLFQNDLVNARATIEAALQYDMNNNACNASALHGIIALRHGDEVAARGAFVRAIGQADEILSKTAEYYSALDAKGIAICGLILCDGRGDPSRSTEATDKSGRVALTDAAGRGDPSMLTGANDGKTAPPDKSTVSAGWVAPTVDDAIETFRKARKIAPHAGVVKRVLRLFDELAKCDTEGILKDVRSAIEGTH